MLAKEPRLLTGGASFEFAAACEFGRALRTLGHGGISVCHTCMDRAALTSLTRCLHQRQEAQCDPDLKPDIDPDHEMLKFTVWFVETGCAIRDTSKALNWSAKPWHSTQLVMICTSWFATSEGASHSGFSVRHPAFEGRPRRPGPQTRESFLADNRSDVTAAVRSDPAALT